MNPEQKPISPTELIEEYDRTLPNVIAQLITQVNGVLRANIGKLIEGKKISVSLRHPANVDMWISYHRHVIEEYRKAGWHIERNEETETTTSPVYKFSGGIVGDIPK